MLFAQASPRSHNPSNSLRKRNIRSSRSSNFTQTISGGLSDSRIESHDSMIHPVESAYLLACSFFYSTFLLALPEQDHEVSGGRGGHVCPGPIPAYDNYSVLRFAKNTWYRFLADLQYIPAKFRQRGRGARHSTAHNALKGLEEPRRNM